MGFQARFFPDAMHRVLADSQCGRQFPATPMRGTVAGFLAGGGQNPGPQRESEPWPSGRGDRCRARRARIRGSAASSGRSWEHWSAACA
jgi:hypothetical protein